jgi:hypothetical protein
VLVNTEWNRRVRSTTGCVSLGTPDELAGGQAGMAVT